MDRLNGFNGLWPWPESSESLFGASNGEAFMIEEPFYELDGIKILFTVKTLSRYPSWLYLTKLPFPEPQDMRFNSHYLADFSYPIVFAVLFQH